MFYDKLKDIDVTSIKIGRRKNVSLLSKLVDFMLVNRKKNNDHVIALMRGGHKFLAVVDASATWWAPRPIIRKNFNALTLIRPRPRHLRLVPNEPIQSVQKVRGP